MPRRLFRCIASLTLALALSLAGFSPALAAPPANDDFDFAAVVTEPLPFTDAINTSEATTTADDPDCAGQGPTVWYVYTPSQDMQILANTFGSDYDTTLSVYTGTRGNLSQIACNDDSGGLQSAVVFDAFAGQTYFFMIGAFASGPGGNLVFTVDVAPPPPTVDITVNRIGTFNSRTGVATISGTYSCTNADFIDVFVDARQNVGRFSVLGSGGFFVSGTCDGASHNWSAEIFPQNGKFAGGKTMTVTIGFACGPFECASGFVEQTVQLRGGRK